MVQTKRINEKSNNNNDNNNNNTLKTVRQNLDSKENKKISKQLQKEKKGKHYEEKP